MGILRSPEIIETYGRDFIVESVPETATRRQNRLTSYLGRALLIRDAHYLCNYTVVVHEYAIF